MAQDHYLKLVLTVIAVALSVLALAELEAPAAAGAAVHIAEPSTLRGQDSMLPVRWRIPFAEHVDRIAVGAMDCATVVSVAGFGTDPTSVEVEFYDHGGTLVGESNAVLDPPEEPDLHVTNDDVELTPFVVAPFVADSKATTGAFVGYALVLADDPRIFVGAHLVCHENGASDEFPAVVTNLSAFPVGQTLAFFQAGVPGMSPTPPRIGSEP